MSNGQLAPLTRPTPLREQRDTRLPSRLGGLGRYSNVPALITSAVIGLFLATFGLWATANAFIAPIGIYDEGILLSGANSILHRALPFRDFYTNYPPGIFMVIAGMWRVLGVSVLSTRVLGFLLHLFIAILAGRLAGRCVGRRFSWLAFGLVPPWLVTLSVQPYAWVAALAMALLFVELFRLAFQGEKRGAWVASGLAWGALLAFRHDLFCYFNAVISAVLLLFIGVRLVRQDGRHPRVNGSAIASFAAGALIPTLIFWAPILVSTPVSRIVGDLLLEQLQIRLARALPLPELMAMRDAAPLPVRLPAMMAGTLEAAVALCFVAPAIAALLWLGSKWLALKDRAAVVMIGALAIAALPQMMGRTDQPHAVFAVAPALILAATATEGLAARIGSPLFRCLPFVATGLILFLPVRLTAQPLIALNLPRFPHGSDRRSGLPEQVPERNEVLAFIEAQSKPDKGIFIGTFEHRLIFINEVDLYFLADRVGATRYTQFDPNLVNRADIQAEMVADLERKGTPVVILSNCCSVAGEPNESSKPGAGLLDDYIKSHYRLVKATGRYLLLLRKDNTLGG